MIQLTSILQYNFNGGFFLYLYNCKFNPERTFVLHDNETQRLQYLENKSRVEVYPLRRKGDDKPTTVPKLPKNEFRPKQSLGQNFITDVNIIKKMCNALDTADDDISDGRYVIEVGAGIGSITKFLHKKYPKMTAIEIDKRAISQLTLNIPDLDIIHDDVLQVDYRKLSKQKGRRLWVIGNLPFYITSQILFCLVDYKDFIDRAVVTSQLEVANRITAKPSDPFYSILSVVLQLYSDPKILFKIPNYVFYPKPKVQSAVVKLVFDPKLMPKSSPLVLKRLLKDSFGQKRKKFKTSLAEFLKQQEIEKLPDDISELRPQQLTPTDFDDLALWIQQNGNFTIGDTRKYKISDNRRVRRKLGPEIYQESTKIWRQIKHGGDQM